MTELNRIVENLGGEKVFKKSRIGSCVDLIERSREGLPHTVVVELSNHLGVHVKEFVSLIVPSGRTWARRQKSKKLAPDESDRAVRIARVLARATEALGSEEKARNWLQKKTRALGEVKPLSLLDSDLGAEQVVSLLGRIERGVFS